MSLDERKIAENLFELITSNAAPDWFTEQELAVYLRLVDKDGKPTTAGIKTWRKRNPGDNPLPVRYVGDKPRFFRPDVIRWTEEETRRKNSEHDNGVVTPFPSEVNNASALTAAAS